MGRWTQYDGDAYRLPEGMKRIGYDADSQRYTFKDTATGQLYHGEPRSEYGTLHPIKSTVKSRMSQDSEDDDDDSWVPPMIPRKPSVDIKSFSDILPDAKIASPSTSDSPSSESHESPADRFRRVVRNTAFPKMNNVVQNAMRRSGTLRRRPADTQSIMSEKTLVDTDSFIDDKKKRSVSESLKSEKDMLDTDSFISDKKKRSVSESLKSEKDMLDTDTLSDKKERSVSESLKSEKDMLDTDSVIGEKKHRSPSL